MKISNENKLNETELTLAIPEELLARAKKTVESAKGNDLFLFTLRYDANRADDLRTVLQAACVVLEEKKEDTITVHLTMEQLQLLKELDFVEQVLTEEDSARPEIPEHFVSREASAAEVVQMATAPEPETPATGSSAGKAGMHDAETAADGSAAVAVQSSCCECPTNKDMESAKTIAVESFVSGCICCPGAEQWFKFTVPESKTYTIYSSGSLDTIGTLLDCCGNKLATNDDYAGKLNFRMIQNLTAGTTYYVKVRAFGNTTGSYTFRVTDRMLASRVSIHPVSITLEKGVLYELPVTPDYTYKGYLGAKRIPRLSVSLTPANAAEQKIWWWEQYGGVLKCSYGWDDDGDRYIHIIANGIGTSKLYAQDWNENGMRGECTVIVYCGGKNYRDVTQHSMVLQNDGYYVCSKCGYRIKSPALQDKDILSDEDYYTVLSCYMSIPYYSKIDVEDEGNYSIRATALRIIIDDIRSKSQYSRQYEYVGSNGTYRREYTVGNENDSFYMPVSIDYNVIDNAIELALNNGVASGVIDLLVGWKIPSAYQFLFFDLADVYTNLTDFLCGLAENAGYKEIGIILKLILFGASINEMAVTDKLVKIQFSVGAAIYISKTVFDSNGNIKFQEHSVA